MEPELDSKSLRHGSFAQGLYHSHRDATRCISRTDCADSLVARASCLRIEQAPARELVGRNPAERVRPDVGFGITATSEISAPR